MFQILLIKELSVEVCDATEV